MMIVGSFGIPIMVSISVYLLSLFEPQGKFPPLFIVLTACHTSRPSMNSSTDSASAAGFPPDSQIREGSLSFLSKRFLIPQASAVRNWEDPGPPSPTPTFPFSEVSLLKDSDHRQPGYRPDIWSLLTVHVSTMRFSNRVPELALVQSLIPSLKKRGH